MANATFFKTFKHSFLDEYINYVMIMMNILIDETYPSLNMFYFYE